MLQNCYTLITLLLVILCKIPCMSETFHSYNTSKVCHSILLFMSKLSQYYLKLEKVVANTTQTFIILRLSNIWQCYMDPQSKIMSQPSELARATVLKKPRLILLYQLFIGLILDLRFIELTWDCWLSIPGCWQVGCCLYTIWWLEVDRLPHDIPWIPFDKHFSIVIFIYFIYS